MITEGEDEGEAERDPLAVSPGSDPDDPSLTPVQSLFASGVHFLSHSSSEPLLKGGKEDETDRPPDSASVRRELLEYLIQPDGTVVCKWCGEVLPSRTHWYRHKYKFHVQSPPGTASLFKCHRCNVFFKSRKGYHGHVTSRHSGVSDRPTKEKKEEVEECESAGEAVEVTVPTPRGRRGARHDEIPVEEYHKQRQKEEKLVADIIEKVKKECEAAGSTVTRRGYTRRQTVMNS